MKNTLSQFLEKKGIKDVSELTSEERQQYEQWQSILAKEDLTIDDIKKFCEAQILNIEAMFKDLDASKDRLERLVTQHSVYKALVNIINGPKAERESLENYLTSLLDK